MEDERVCTPLGTRFESHANRPLRNCLHYVGGLEATRPIIAAGCGNYARFSFFFLA